MQMSNMQLLSLTNAIDLPESCSDDDEELVFYKNDTGLTEPNILLSSPSTSSYSAELVSTTTTPTRSTFVLTTFLGRIFEHAKTQLSVSEYSESLWGGMYYAQYVLHRTQREMEERGVDITDELLAERIGCHAQLAWSEGCRRANEVHDQGHLEFVELHKRRKIRLLKGCIKRGIIRGCVRNEQEEQEQEESVNKNKYKNDNEPEGIVLVRNPPKRAHFPSSRSPVTDTTFLPPYTDQSPGSGWYTALNPVILLLGGDKIIVRELTVTELHSGGWEDNAWPFAPEEIHETGFLPTIKTLTLKQKMERRVKMAEKYKDQDSYMDARNRAERRNVMDWIENGDGED